jgi:hypothetical protein
MGALRRGMENLVGTGGWVPPRYSGGVNWPRRTTTLIAAFWAAALLAASPDDYATAKAKIDQIENNRAAPGSHLTFTPGELNAYIAHETPTVTDGVRNPRLELWGPGIAHGSALIDFAKLRASQGHPPGWLLSKLLEGEHPVAVTARVQSGGGQATVEVQRVEISGIAVDGATLDFLIQHFLLPLYPDAVVGRPFSLEHGMERVDIQPRGVTVMFGRETKAR